MTKTSIRIATRSSPLALWQANFVKDELQKTDPELSVELVHVTTGGDRNVLDPLQSFGGMGAFTKEVQLAVLEGRADIAVHSLKDLPTEPTPGLTIACVPEREQTFDVIVFPSHRRRDVEILTQRLQNPENLTSAELEEIVDHSIVLTLLSENAVVGTGSLRRRAQLLHERPDLELKEIRGNVDTRIQKLESGDYDAIVLAFAGIHRLKRDLELCFLPLDHMLPAVGQGALGLEIRENDSAIAQMLRLLDHHETHLDVIAERALLRTLRAGCHAPVGVETGMIEAKLWMINAVVLSADGQQRVDEMTAQDHAPRDAREAETVGVDLAHKLIQQGADKLLGHS